MTERQVFVRGETSPRLRGLNRMLREGRSIGQTVLTVNREFFFRIPALRLNGSPVEIVTCKKGVEWAKSSCSA